MVQRSASEAVQAKTMTSPGVRIPPPPIYAAALGVSWLLQRVVPLPFLTHDTAILVALPILVVGIAFTLLSIVTMVRGRGTLNTNAASRALVVTGVYRFSRNPMYVTLAMLYIGFAVALGLPWGLVLLPLLLVYTQSMVIAREERFLASAFGQQYTDYAARVRRWL